MLQSKLFTKTKKEAPKDEVALNAKLLTRAGFVHKEMAGVYSYLPLGLKVLKKIERIIREEMKRIEGQELYMSALQNRELWEKTGRWKDEDYDIWFKTKLHSGNKFHQGGEIGLATTHEEPLSNMLKQFVESYKDLPVYLFQFQTKFRNELRAKSGIMRGREFLMKDLYSFCRTEKEQKDYYERVRKSYLRIFERLGLGDITYVTYALGGSFSKYSIEFQTLTESGEDKIYVCDKCKVAVNEEIKDEHKHCPECGNKELQGKKAVEVGNIFNLGTKFSEALGLKYKDDEGKENSVWMGSYGIGLGRVMGTIAEVLADDKGLIWPENITPYTFHLIALGDSEKIKKVANELYEKLRASNISVLYDDRDKSPGEKFADADLIGIPYQVIVGQEGLEKNIFEFKDRKSGEIKEINQEKILEELV